MADAENEEKELENKVYEVGYLLLPKLTEEEIPVVYGNLKELVGKLGGQIIADEMPKMITLAYSMSKVIANIRSKFSTAHFGWIKFYMDPEKVAELKKTLTFDPNFLRFLIMKTVKENTIAAKRFVGRDSVRRKPFVAKRTEEGETALPINKEEIDKEIEALVATE